MRRLSSFKSVISLVSFSVTSKFIVCTTINQITQALEKFASFSDWNLIIVGDLKTPKDYKLSGALYLAPEDQVKISSELSELIGWNCIQRRNFGIIEALKNGADVIATVDDDNIPFDDWGKNLKIGKSVKLKEYRINEIAFDPIGATNESHLWHRGFPLELIPSRKYSDFDFVDSQVDVQADFWNGDPDIDAICRLEHRPECNFESKYFPLTSNKLSPFNSQNTFLSGRVAREYFLYPHIGRMDDIWASYYVQALGFKVIYEKPSVFQARNEHNLIEDMKREYIGYENNFKLIHDLYIDPNNIKKYLPETSIKAWDVYRKILNK